MEPFKNLHQLWFHKRTHFTANQYERDESTGVGSSVIRTFESIVKIQVHLLGTVRMYALEGQSRFTIVPLVFGIVPSPAQR